MNVEDAQRVRTAVACNSAKGFCFQNLGERLAGENLFLYEINNSIWDRRVRDHDTLQAQCIIVGKPFMNIFAQDMVILATILFSYQHIAITDL